MRTVILVPRREDHGPRDLAWMWCRARWERLFPDATIYEGHHTRGPFNRSAAVNLAADLADQDGRWDFAIVIDADIFLRASQVRAALDRAHDTGRVTWAHRRWRGIEKAATRRLLADSRDFGAEIDHDDMDLLVERTTPMSWSCCFVVPRPVWDDSGGFDERFIGWGFEDMAWQSLISGLYGHERIEGDVYHLWHPRSEDRIVLGEAGSTASREYAVNARLGRRYMVALRRDHGLHDRSDTADEAERQRDIANLKRDDAILTAQTRRLKLPDWSEWWPTLPELRDGAKAAKGAVTVTVVVHTDGRRDYISRAIPSLMDRVSGPIVKRVIYDDSGDPAYKTWLTAEFGPLGFYVAGPTERLGFTQSMRAMWSYLNRRCPCDYVMAVEDDFIYSADVNLSQLIAVLRERPYLAQIALLRQACYPREIEAGGILGWPQEQFTPTRMNGYGWMEHRLFWTNNPSLFRHELTASQWPMQKSSERVFGDRLLKDEQTRFAFWGAGTPMVEHIGVVRAGSGY